VGKRRGKTGEIGEGHDREPLTLTIRPNRQISNLRLTLTAISFEESVKVNLRWEMGGFNLIVRVGGCARTGVKVQGVG
jgi:hypothetical protein